MIYRLKPIVTASTTFGCLLLLTLVSGVMEAIAAGDGVSAADYPSLQTAIDENPGGVIYVPPGQYELTAPLMIQHDGTVLQGFGRISQTNPELPVVRVDHADNVVLRDLVLTRPAETAETVHAGVYAEGCKGLRIQNVSVIDNWTRLAAIRLEGCVNGLIEGCEITNYKRISIDDRSTSPLSGYAFRCIDGAGIGVSNSVATSILNNRVIENRLLPTREMMKEHGLGELIEGKVPTKFGELGLWVQKLGYAKHWHQGSAIVVTGPEITSFTRISGNYIENCAQGIDIHSDNFICTENTVTHGMMGMKAMHGSRNGIISRNVFSHVDNWGIMLGPGTASHAAQPAVDDKPERRANADGGVIISGNIISDFGYGHEFWNWAETEDGDAAVSAAIRIERGQLADNPPLSDVLIEGNIVTNAGDEGSVKDGEVVKSKPRYRYAVIIDTAAPNSGETHYPTNIRIAGNLFEPGASGICNVPLPDQK
jgi:hypothetical protein